MVEKKSGFTVNERKTWNSKQKIGKRPSKKWNFT